MNDIFNRLQGIIVEIDESIKKEDITLNSQLVQDFEFDSIEMVFLIVKMEEEFEIEIDQEELSLENLSSIDRLINMVNKYGSGN